MLMMLAVAVGACLVQVLVLLMLIMRAVAPRLVQVRLFRLVQALMFVKLMMLLFLTLMMRAVAACLVQLLLLVLMMRAVALKPLCQEPPGEKRL